jgi:glycosyltransferase involved in cell wall biosynthesis
MSRFTSNHDPRTSTTPDGLVMICDVDLEVPDATRTHTVEVARCFAAEGLHVDLVTRGYDPHLPGVTHHRAYGSESGRARRVLDLSLRSLAVLCRRRRTAERCYVRHKWSNVPIMLAARLLGYRLVTQVDEIAYGRGHELPIHPAVDYVKRFATIVMACLSNGIVAVTPEIKELLVHEFRAKAERIAALPNGVDIDAFRPIPRTEAIARVGLDPACGYVVFCGHFQPWVDFDTILSAFALVASDRADARLVLVGDGLERERVERDVRALTLDDRVLITGFVSDRAKVMDYLCVATVTLAAHRREHVGHFGVSPTKLAEYLAVGRAVVAVDVPGLREALEQSGAGVVVQADPQAMADAIGALLNDPKRADELGASGRRLAEERYSWRSIVQRTLPLFGT